MRIFKAVGKVLAFAGLVLLLNIAFSFALEPASGSSDTMWSDYRKEKDLNVVYTGSSFCLRSFNPYVIDEILGTNSYNMGTPAQAINQTYVAIKTAIEEHDLDTVVLAINYSSLESDWPVGAKVTFMEAKGKNGTALDWLKNTVSFMLDEENRGESTSINFLFPWIYNHVSMDKQSILANIRAKMTGNVVQEVNPNDPESVYVGKGFAHYLGVVNYNAIGNTNSRTLYTNEFAVSAFEVIEDIIALCQENDVELIAINAPRPVFDIISYGEDYFAKYDRLKRLFGENGAEYYDFNLIKPEIMEMKDEYFVDVEHLNKEGADEFSKCFAKFLQVREVEGDMEHYFFSKDEYLSSVDYITNVYFNTKVQEDGIMIQANAYHGSDVEVEYEFSLWNPESDTYIVLREYGAEKEYIYIPEGTGTYSICVKVREVGTDIDYDRYYKKEVTF